MKKFVFLSLTASIGILSAADVRLELRQGWNMISPPFNGSFNASKLTSSDKVKSVWYYNPGSSAYEAPTSIELGRGYWVNSTADTAITISNPTIQSAVFSPKSMLLACATGGVWNMGGTSVVTTKTALKSLGATVIWPYDPTLAAYSSDDTIAAGLGFWLKRSDTLPSVQTVAANTEIAGISSVILQAALSNSQTAQVAQAGSLLGVSGATTMGSSVSAAGSSTTAIPTIPRSLRALSAAAAQMKTSLTAALANIPEPIKSQLSSQLSAASDDTALITACQSIAASSMGMLPSSTCSISSGATTTAVPTVSIKPPTLSSEQIAQLDKIAPYMDSQAKTVYDSWKVGTLTDISKLSNFSASVQNAAIAMGQAQIDADPNTKLMTFIDTDGEMEMTQAVQNVQAKIRMAMYANGQKIAYNFNKIENWLKLDANGSNVAPLKDLIVNNKPDFSKLKIKMRVLVPSSLVVSGGSVTIKSMESDFLPMPSGVESIPNSILFTGEGNISLSDGTTWAQKSMKTTVYPKNPSKFQGTYEISENRNGATIKGIASFDETGCKGAELTKDGAYLGRVILEGGKVWFEDSNGTRSETSALK